MEDQKHISSPTLDDVARLAGVASSTVSRVLNNKGQIGEDTAQRVRDAVEKLNYKPHAAARGLASGKVFSLGLIALEVSSTFFGQILEGVESVTRNQGYDLLIHATRGEVAKEAGYQRPLGPHNTDGLLIHTDALSSAELQYLSSINFPMVLLHQSAPESLPIPNVTFENKNSAFNLVNHLIDVHGYRRIAFIRGRQEQEHSTYREMGYKQSLTLHGIPIQDELIGEGGFAANETEKQVMRWLESGIEIDAIFAFDDDTAMSAIYTLSQAGLRVPEDIAVVGFDDAYPRYYLGPAITTVQAPIRDVGAEAAKQLLKIINQQDVPPLTLLPTELKIRRSCGCQ